MEHGLESALGRACARWIAAVDRQPARVLASVLGLTAALGLYAAVNLGINADTHSLINERLPFQVRQRELTKTFRTLGDGVLVVIDADSPAAAHRAADALAAGLAGRTDLFTQVHVPGGGPFFERNALLYLEPAQLEDLTDRLSALQPFLAELARDQSLVGLAGLIGQALAAERDGTRIGLDINTALDRISAAVEATNAGRRAVDPWGTALLGGALPDEARRRVVELRPRLDYDTLLNAAPHLQAIRDVVRALGLDPERGTTVRITGEPVLNYEELIAVGTQSRHVAVISFVLFSATVCFALRSARVVLALVGSLLVSLVWSNAFAAATVGSLNQISAAFNVLIIGLGGEFGIHFCMRYAELRAAGRTRAEALTGTGSSVGPSLFSSAGTTAIGFFIFLFTDFTGVAQLGLISGVGMFLSLASTLTVLPALLAIGAPGRTAAAQPVARPWIARLEHLPLRYAGAIRIAAAVLGLLGISLLPRVRFDHNLLNLRDPNTESVATFEDLLAHRGSSPWSIDIVAPDLPRAQATAQSLEMLPVVGQVRTLADYVPTGQDEKLEILETASYFVPAAIVPGPTPSEAAQRGALETLAAEVARTAARGGDEALVRSARRLRTVLGEFLAANAVPGRAAEALARLQENVVGSLPEQLGELAPLLSPQRVTLVDLPADLKEQMLASDGRARIEVFPREDVSESAALERFVDAVRAQAPDAAGGAVWLVEWGRVTWGAMLQALLGGMVCMVLFLVLLWRSVWDSLLAFFPLALAALLTCATLVLLGQPFNFANVIVLPMLIGMGVDNGVHLVHRHRTNPEEVDVLATSTARAVFYAALTTMLSFGSLAFASHRGIAAIGQLLTIGVGLTLVCYVVALPAVLEWDDRRRRGG